MEGKVLLLRLVVSRSTHRNENTDYYPQKESEGGRKFSESGVGNGLAAILTPFEKHNLFMKNDKYANLVKTFELTLT